MDPYYHTLYTWFVVYSCTPYDNLTKIDKHIACFNTYILLSVHLSVLYELYLLVSVSVYKLYSMV